MFLRIFQERKRAGEAIGISYRSFPSSSLGRQRPEALASGDLFDRLNFGFPRPSVGTHALAAEGKIGMHSQARTMERGNISFSFTFLVPTVLRGNEGMPAVLAYKTSMTFIATHL